MLVVINQLSVKAEWVDRIESAFLEHLDLLKSTPGFKSFRFLKPFNAAESPCMVEVCWEDEASLENWKSSAHFRASHANMGALREAFSAPPKFGRFSVSHSLPGQA